MQKTSDTMKIGDTLYVVNNSFADKTTPIEAWLSIITRSEKDKMSGKIHQDAVKLESEY